MSPRGSGLSSFKELFCTDTSLATPPCGEGWDGSFVAGPGASVKSGSLRRPWEKRRMGSAPAACHHRLIGFHSDLGNSHPHGSGQALLDQPRV